MRTPRGWLLLATVFALVSLTSLIVWAALSLPSDGCQSSASDCSDAGDSAWAAPLEVLTYASAAATVLALAIAILLVARRRRARGPSE